MKDKNASAVEKLYSSLAKGLGTFLVPQKVRKVLESEMHGIAESNNSISTIEVEGLDVSSGKAQQLYKNTCNRLLFQEMKKQQNIEKIVKKAEKIIRDTENISDEPVSQDWVTRFINSIEDVSEVKMQDIWSKILAGEIKSPKTFSLRTLDALTKISREEAELFEELCGFCVNLRGTLAIINDENLNKRFHIAYEKVLLLSECGLIDSSTFISITNVINRDMPFNMIYGNKIIWGYTDTEVGIKTPIYKLTSIGIQLYKIIKVVVNEEYLNAIEEYIVKMNPNVSFSEHDIVELCPNGQIRYKTEGKILPKKDRT